jgi:hypothetical protein
MLKVTLIGAGDIKFHYFELLKIPENKFYEQLDSLAKILAETSEIILSPDRGICFEIAKKYRQFNGKKICGVAPLSDKVFGIEHIKPYINAEINGKKLFDELINTETWYKQHFAYSLFGDVILMLGSSLGTLYELASGFFAYKIFMGNKPGLKIMKSKVHEKIVAGDKIPLSIIIYKPFMKEDIGFEIKEYIKKIGCKIYYAEDTNELKDILMKLEKK